MKKPKIVLVIGWYLILISLFSLPSFINNRIPYQVDMTSFDFAYLCIYWILSFMVLLSVIAGIGLLFIKQWARIFVIILCCFGVLLQLVSSVLNFYTKLDKNVFFYILGSIVYLVIIYILNRPRIKNIF